MKRITIKDIAQLLQISPSTVSRAMKDHPDISVAVKNRVKEIADEFNYVPNDFAVNFRKKSSKVIGLIIPKMSMFFVPSIIEGISSKLNKEGYQFFILSSEESVDIERANLQTCANSNVGGIIISLTRQTKDYDHFKKIDALEIPVVVFDKYISGQKYDHVIFDNEHDAEECARRLIDYKCKRILAIFGNDQMEITAKRKAGFLNFIEKNPDVFCQSVSCDSAEETKEKLESILEHEKFDGIFAMSDEILAGLNYALKARELSAKNFKVIAISEGIFPKYLNPYFEFIKNDGFKMGVEAADILLKKIIEKNSMYA